MREHPPYREVRQFYLGGAIARVPSHPLPTIRPRPGYGTVYILQQPDGIWEASWQDHSCPDEQGNIVGGVEGLEGDEETVLAWAKTRPAEQILIFSPDADDYLPLPPS